MPRYLAARCHSTVPEWLVPHLLTSGCRLSCCVVWLCSRVRRGCLGTLLKSYVIPSHPISTLQSTGTPSIDRWPATTFQNNASPIHPIHLTPASVQAMFEGRKYGKSCRRPRHHPSPILLPCQHSAAGEQARFRGRERAQGAGVPRDTYSGQPGCTGHGGF